MPDAAFCLLSLLFPLVVAFPRWIQVGFEFEICVCSGKGCLVSFEQFLAFGYHFASAASPREPLASRVRPSLRAAQTAAVASSQEGVLL